MKIYVPALEKSPSQEFHLSVYHGLHPVELDEDKIIEILEDHSFMIAPHSNYMMSEGIPDYSFDNVAKAILQYIEEKGQG